jgi:hypothetical protein
MSPGEKLAAEWEARHDVAARGRRPSAESVQHYVETTRAREQRSGAPGRLPGSPGSTAGAVRGAAAADPVRAGAQASSPARDRRRSWWCFWRRG